jgi:protein-arginine kinase activator protein McsA
LKVQMDEAIRKCEFEKAALIRDQIKEISWD